MVQRRVPIKSLPRSNSEANRADKVRRIIYERTMDLCEKKGFRGTSMNDIAEACGVSKPAIYHYFRNKMHILETLYEEVTTQIFLTMERLAHSTDGAVARLQRMIELQALYNIENRRFLTIFWRERQEFDDVSRKALAGHEREFEAWVLRILEDGQARGEFGAHDPKVVMLGILGMLSTVHRWAPYAGKAPQDLARELGNLILDGVAIRAEPSTGAGRSRSGRDSHQGGARRNISAQADGPQGPRNTARKPASRGARDGQRH